jgi:hypothetical protein
MLRSAQDTLREESLRETLRYTQGDKAAVPIFCGPT